MYKPPPDALWLIIVSSNFLHAGEWTTHLENVYSDMHTAVETNRFLQIKFNNNLLTANPVQTSLHSSPNFPLENNSIYSVFASPTNPLSSYIFIK